LASIKKGETILDLGCGAGFDCFLASKEISETGKVIGVDITPEMVKKAKQNAKIGNYNNIEFKIGEIENLPIQDNSIDLIISNCVINLSNQKEKVFEEAYRVLKPGGRMMISDIILLKELPDFVKNSVEGYIACLAGAVLKENYINAATLAGFKEIQITNEALQYINNFPLFNDQEYYQYLYFGFPDFEMVIENDKGAESYKYYYINKYYNLLLYHLICLRQIKNDYKQVKKLILGSILKEDNYYNYSQNKKTIKELYYFVNSD
jgi:ubiquinone/menaquinone biosynthesis C-methylase UbiE